jgi:hypothetical protein
VLAYAAILGVQVAVSLAMRVGHTAAVLSGVGLGQAHAVCIGQQAAACHCSTGPHIVDKRVVADCCAHSML